MTEGIGSLLRRFDVRLKKSLGQNLLHEEHWLEQIVAAGDVGSDDLVLEIGPGAGSLTKHLSQAALQVVAVELDGRFMNLLDYTLAGLENVHLVHGDILALDVGKLVTERGVRVSEGYKIVANIPYYITAPILRHVLESDFKPNVVVVTLQSEVAKRIVASPGDMSVLAVSVQFYGLPQLMGRIPSGAFYPRPESDSCIVRIDLYDNFQVPVSDADGFFRVVKAGFGQRRKQLQNALSSGLGIERDHVASALLDAGIDPRRRAQTLALEEWALIHEHLPVAF